MSGVLFWWTSRFQFRTFLEILFSIAEYSYDKNAPATLYIHEIKLSNGKHAFKYGITNNDYKARAKKQRRGIDGTLKNIFNFRSSGITVLDTETLIARHFNNEGYLTKEEMSITVTFS